MQKAGKEQRLFIESTLGLWVRKNTAEDSLEIWYDGKCYVAWDQADLIEERLNAMMRIAMEIGEVVAKKEIRRALGIKENENE